MVVSMSTMHIALPQWALLINTCCSSLEGHFLLFYAFASICLCSSFRNRKHSRMFSSFFICFFTVIICLTGPISVFYSKVNSKHWLCFWHQSFLLYEYSSWLFPMCTCFYCSIWSVLVSISYLAHFSCHFIHFVGFSSQSYFSLPSLSFLQKL